MKARTKPMKGAGNGMFVEEQKEKSSVMGQRKKGMGVRVWLMIDAKGKAQPVEAGKHAIMRRACLPARDLRILDPLLSYPSTILGRERAIVVNLEHIKVIITAQEVLLLNSKDPAVAPIVLDLQRRLPLHFNSLGQQVPGDGGGGLSDQEGETNHKPPTNTPTEGLSQGPSRADLHNLETRLPDVHMTEPNAPRTPLEFMVNEVRGADSSPPRANAGPSVLPFEFRALEVCLEAACSFLDAEASLLEREAYPALDELTSKLSTLNLEHVRQIKSRLVAISGRVQKVRDEIEQLLDDDGDMAEMYLTDKLLGAQMEGTMSPSLSNENSKSASSRHFEVSKRDLQAEATQLSQLLSSQLFETQENEADDQRLVRPVPDMSRFGVSKEISGVIEDLSNPGESFTGACRVDNRHSTTTSGSSSRGKLDVEELEMLLEAYFVQIEGTLNKLSTLREYVDDTEDYINIMLDDKQNHLLQMGVLLTTATLVASAFIVVTGIFGMNIDIPLFNSDSYRTSAFIWVVCGSLIGCCVVYVAAIAWCKYKRLIE